MSEWGSIKNRCQAPGIRQIAPRLNIAKRDPTSDGIQLVSSDTRTQNPKFFP